MYMIDSDQFLANLIFIASIPTHSLLFLVTEKRRINCDKNSESGEKSPLSLKTLAIIIPALHFFQRMVLQKLLRRVKVFLTFGSGTYLLHFFRRDRRAFISERIADVS